MNLIDDLVTFLHDETLTDVTLRSRDGSDIRAHKIVLAARSRRVCVCVCVCVCTYVICWTTCVSSYIDSEL